MGIMLSFAHLWFFSERTSEKTRISRLRFLSTFLDHYNRGYICIGPFAL
jgi:hypothetical protein